MKTVKSKRNSASVTGPQGGFTLIEILVSITLIAIAILGFTLNTVGVIKGNHSSSNFTAATNLAQDKLEQIKAQTAWVNVNYCPESGEQSLTATGVAGGSYKRCWMVRDSPLGNALKQIDVTVSWHDYSTHAVNVSTLIFTQ